MANEKRLIGANALSIKVMDASYWDNQDEDVIWNLVQDAPTVDAVEVVHAHWEDGCAMHNGKEVYKSIDCSHCEEVFKIESETREYWKARFKVCPFCGAVMDGERREGE